MAVYGEDENDEQSPLFKKLDVVAIKIGKYGPTAQRRKRPTTTVAPQMHILFVWLHCTFAESLQTSFGMKLV